MHPDIPAKGRDIVIAEQVARIAALESMLREADRILAAIQEPDTVGDISIVRERIRAALSNSGGWCDGDTFTPLIGVSRFEVIDETGRAYVTHGVTVSLSYQDNGRTLKVFVTKK